MGGFSFLKIGGDVENDIGDAMLEMEKDLTEMERDHLQAVAALFASLYERLITPKDAMFIYHSLIVRYPR